MQDLNNVRAGKFFAGLALLISGCATEQAAPPPSAQILSGDQMLRESQGIAHLSDRWKSGKQLIDRGNLQVREGQTKVDEGNRMIEEGEKIVRESEESYKNIKQ